MQAFHHRFRAFWLGICLLAAGPVQAAGGGAAGYLKKPDEWFSTPEARRIAGDILSYQSDLGGWPKNTDTTGAPYVGDRKDLLPTFDNGATTDELRFLARCFNATKDEPCRSAFSRGLGYILKAQYPTGGWPQFYPPGKQYHRHITYNDGAMVRVMEFLREVSQSETYSFVPIAERRAAAESFEKGVTCILKCQIRVNGRPTVWCAQHDELDFSPQPGRAFELASFSGSESVGITRLLMSLDTPSPEVVAAVEGAVGWLKSARVDGIRLERKPDPQGPGGKDLVVVEDPGGEPLWARFYDLATAKPVFSDRDGIPKSSLAGIGYERRNHYSWYGDWPRRLIDQDFPRWQERRAKARESVK